MLDRFKAAAALVALAGSVAGAKTIFVNHANPTPGDGSSWSAAFLEIQDAFAVALAGDEIWVARGVYYPGTARDEMFVLPDGVSLFGGFLGTETQVWQRKINYRTILSGDIDGDGTHAGNSYTVVGAFGSQPTLLSSVWIEGGNADGHPGTPTNIYGGGVFVSHSDLRIEQCRIRNNVALGGGGVYVFHAQGASLVRFWRTFFNDNMAIGPSVLGYGFGGAIGALSNDQGVPPRIEIDRSHFTANFAEASGGAVSVYGELQVSNSVFSANTALGVGGGVYAGCCTVWLTNNSFYANHADLYGGGVLVSHATLTNNIIWGNTGAGGSRDRFAQVGGANPLVFAHHNDIEGWDGIFSGVGNFDADPRFVDPDGPDNVLGTLDDSLGILRSSPCVQGGDSAYAWGAKDFAGATRIAAPLIFLPAIVDVGAYEIQPLSLGGPK